MNKEDFHVDMSGRIYEKKNIGIALVGTDAKTNYGCVIKSNLLQLIKRYLFEKNIYYDSAKLYAICIYLLVRDIKNNVNTLIICNDENFNVVRGILDYLLKDYNFEIINISEFRKRLGRDIGSLADNYAKIYRRRGLKLTRQNRGKKINVIEVNFKLIKQYWEELKENKL